jgi:hypothetical protein
MTFSCNPRIEILAGTVQWNNCVNLVSNFVCNIPNPVTGSCSCPSGARAVLIFEDDCRRVNEELHGVVTYCNRRTYLCG